MLINKLSTCDNQNAVCKQRNSSSTRQIAHLQFETLNQMRNEEKKQQRDNQKRRRKNWLENIVSPATE